MRFRGDRLKGIREAKGLTLKELGLRSGVHLSRLGRYEAGPDEPRAANLAQIADALEVSSDYVLGRKWDDRVPFRTVAARESLEIFLRANPALPPGRIAVLQRVAEDANSPVSVEAWTALVRFIHMSEEETRTSPRRLTKANAPVLRVLSRKERRR